jgi:hypothetical protein
MELYHDELRCGVGPFEQSDKMASDAWWPLLLESLRRHAEASYFSGEDEQFLFGEAADLGGNALGNAPEDHGSGSPRTCKSL